MAIIKQARFSHGKYTEVGKYTTVGLIIARDDLLRGLFSCSHYFKHFPIAAENFVDVIFKHFSIGRKKCRYFQRNSSYPFPSSPFYNPFSSNISRPLCPAIHFHVKHVSATKYFGYKIISVFRTFLRPYNLNHFSLVTC